MNTDTDKQMDTDLLYPELSYKVRGAVMAVSNKYGKGLKESIYQAALAEEFQIQNISFKQQARITIYSLKTGKPLSSYVPDFVIEDKVVLERVILP